MATVIFGIAAALVTLAAAVAGLLISAEAEAGARMQTGARDNAGR